MEHWVKKIGKIATKHVQNTFGLSLGTIFGNFGILKVFSIFLKIFGKSTLHGTLGKSLLEKIAPKHVQNTFGDFWKRFCALLECWIFLNFGKKSKAQPCMEHGAIFFSKKLPQNMFKTSLDNFRNDVGHFCVFETFLIFSKTFDDSMEHWRKKRFKKIAPKHVWTLGNVFGHFRNFETVLIFPLFFSESLPQNLSPENWTQNFQVRKTEFIFLSSGIWTHNFKSRTSEVELRILTVARMQRECLLSIVS